MQNWSIPKGMIDVNETPKEAALRETFEESNIDLSNEIDKIKYIGEQKYAKYNKTIIGFICKIENINTLKCSSLIPLLDDKGRPNRNGGKPENDVVKFYSFKEAMKLLHEAQVKLIKNYLQR